MTLQKLFDSFTKEKILFCENKYFLCVSTFKSLLLELNWQPKFQIVNVNSVWSFSAENSLHEIRKICQVYDKMSLVKCFVKN